MNVLLLGSPDIAQFRMRGSLQSHSLLVMNKDLLINLEGEMMDLEGLPGQLTLVPSFVIGRPEAQGDGGAPPEPQGLCAEAGLEPGTCCGSQSVSPCQGTVEPSP